LIDIYSKPELYDAIHTSYIWDEKLIARIGKKTGGPVLELGSGTGRLAKVILGLGLDYTGIDLSRECTEVAKKRYGDKAIFHIKNMQNFDLKSQFQFVFIGFNSFLHNLTNEEAKNCLNCIYNHLVDGGTFLLSAFIPSPSFLFRESGKLFPATDFFNYAGGVCRIMETNQFNQDTQVNDLAWYLEKDGDIISDEYRFSQKMYYPHSMDILFEEAGFNVEQKMGDYHGSPMNQESEMQIYVCSKN